MPLPKPKKDESHDDFMSRCMGDEFMNSEYPDNDQRYAVCQSQWETKKSDDTEMELRTILPDDVELRVDGDGSGTLTGYAARFNSWTDLGYFKERIAEGAFDNVLDNDVRALKNHDPNLILGRTTNGTLALTTNKRGLKFVNQLPNTNTGRDVREEVRSGLITGCSFAFTVEEESWNYPDNDAPVERTITKIGQLFDVGPVTYPAYQSTTVSARSVAEAMKEAKNKHEEIEERDDEPKYLSPERMREIEKGYKEAERIKHRVENQNKKANALNRANAQK